VRNRSRSDIVAEILDITLGGAAKTRIMQGAYLSFTQLKEYLTLLTDSGLLDYSEEERVYRTTQRGEYFLKVCGELGRMITIIEKGREQRLYESGLDTSPPR
jgi:predicted transcriptional regulator